MVTPSVLIQSLLIAVYKISIYLSINSVICGLKLSYGFTSLVINIFKMRQGILLKANMPRTMKNDESTIKVHAR